MRRAFVGTRTEPGRGTGEGLQVYGIAGDGESQEPWNLLQTVHTANPGFLALLDNPGSLSSGIICAAHGDGDTLTSYTVSTGDGSVLTDPVDVGTRGVNPAHLALSPDGRHLLAANHSSGTVVRFGVGADGRIGEVSSQLHFPGTPGPHRSDQPGPKPHQVCFLGEQGLFLVPDKGLDTVFTCRVSSDGSLELLHATRLREFSGPRHVAPAPDGRFAFCVNELGNTVAVLDLHGVPETAPRVVQYRATLPDDDVRDSRGSEVLVSPDGRFVYASNRSGAGDSTAGGPGNDSVAVWSVDVNGLLGPVAWFDVGGVRPRFMTFGPGDGELTVALEKSGRIDVLTLDPASGMPVSRRTAAVTGSPVCVVFDTL